MRIDVRAGRQRTSRSTLHVRRDSINSVVAEKPRDAALVSSLYVTIECVSMPSQIRWYYEGFTYRNDTNSWKNATNRRKWSKWDSNKLVKCKCKCLPILLYGLECCPLNKSDVKSLDFAVTRFLMKLFKSVNLDLINECRSRSASTFRSLANC